MKFIFKRLKIPDVLEIEYEQVGDARGFFSETWRKAEFEKAGIPPFVQENHSRSLKGVLRGLHFQRAPKSQGKLMRCLRGSVFDVAVDLRRSSPHYGRWVGCVLSDENRKLMYIPTGFAHGFYVMSDWADILYSQTEYYAPEYEGGIRWDDPDLGIEWPNRHPLLSKKDTKFPFLKDCNHNF